MQQFKGLPASPGIAIGPIWIYRPNDAVVERHTVADPTAEWVRLQVAVAKARTQLQALESRARENIGEEEAEIFAAHDEEELTLQEGVQLALIGRYYERIGDHAVNIGERVRYMVTGALPEQQGADQSDQRPPPDSAGVSDGVPEPRSGDAADA